MRRPKPTAAAATGIGGAGGNRHSASPLLSGSKKRRKQPLRSSKNRTREEASEGEEAEAEAERGPPPPAQLPAKEEGGGGGGTVSTFAVFMLTLFTLLLLLFRALGGRLGMLFGHHAGGVGDGYGVLLAAIPLAILVYWKKQLLFFWRWEEESEERQAEQEEEKEQEQEEVAKRTKTKAMAKARAKTKQRRVRASTVRPSSSGDEAIPEHHALHKLKERRAARRGSCVHSDGELTEQKESERRRRHEHEREEEEEEEEEEEVEEEETKQKRKRNRRKRKKRANKEIVGGGPPAAFMWSNGWTDRDHPYYRELSLDELEELDERDPLAFGAFGVVYKARWRGVECAVKQLTVPISNSSLREEFRQEAAMMQRLGHHPNIITFFGAITKGHHMYIVMEYAELGSVRELMASFGANSCSSPSLSALSSSVHYRNEPRGPLPLDMIIGFAEDAAVGILHLHQENVIHGDIAARNVLVQKGGPTRYRAMLTDFGLSKIKSGMSFVTSASNVGPVKWMAPEAILRKEYSEASDAWSFAVFLWEMVTGEDPWREEDVVTVANKVGREGAHLPVPPYCDPVLASLLEQCWELNPANRPSFKHIHKTLYSYRRRLEHGNIDTSPTTTTSTSSTTSSPSSSSSSLDLAGAMAEAQDGYALTEINLG